MNATPAASALLPSGSPPLHWRQEDEELVVRSLRGHRLDAGLTQAQLATKAGVSLTMVVLVEQGKRLPHFPNRKKIADALGVSVSDVAEFLADIRTPGDTDDARPPA